MPTHCAAAERALSLASTTYMIASHFMRTLTNFGMFEHVLTSNDVINFDGDLRRCVLVPSLRDLHKLKNESSIFPVHR